MKKIIIFIIFIVSAVCAHSQTDSIDNVLKKVELDCNGRQPVPSLLMNDAYKNSPEWGKYKALRAVGWTTFGIGMTATCVGGWLYLLLSSINGSDKAQPGVIVFFSGLGLTTASIPILISAYHYRNKAKKMCVSMGMNRIVVPAAGRDISHIPAMKFSITF